MIRVRNGKWRSIAALIMVVTAASAWADEIGQIKVAKGAVSLERDKQSMPAQVGMRLTELDVLRTGADGSVGVTMKDNSLLSLGPNSVLALDQLRFDPVTGDGRFNSQLRTGSMSVISGRIAKWSPAAMTVTTPRLNLAARGTEFVVDMREAILTPTREGTSSGAVLVTGENQQALLDKPYEAARVDGGRLTTSIETKEYVEEKFGPALAAVPRRAAAFQLFFTEGTDEFTPESKAVFEEVLNEISKYPVPDIVVVGHTDTVGSDPVNDALSRRRAETLKALLVARGISADNVEAVGRGKREPLVPTADGVAEPRNRRVEIVVR